MLFSHSLKHYDLYMLAGSDSPVDNQCMLIMYVGSYVMEDISESHAAGGWTKQAHLLVMMIIIIYRRLLGDLCLELWVVLWGLEDLDLERFLDGDFLFGE